MKQILPVKDHGGVDIHPAALGASDGCSEGSWSLQEWAPGRSCGIERSPSGAGFLVGPTLGHSTPEGLQPLKRFVKDGSLCVGAHAGAEE